IYYGEIAVMKMVRSWMKKWWVVAAVLSLAIVLTSCSNKGKGTVGYAYGQCDGTMGNFDIYVIPSKAQTGLYEVSVIPYTVAKAGDIVNVTIANRSLNYKELVNQVVIQPDVEI